MITDHQVQRISLEEIQVATKSFGNIIGQGGFGSVHKCVLSLSTYSSEPGTDVAVKRLNNKYGQGEKEFFNEIKRLSNCKHDNLVSLLGCCDEGDEKIVVYKYEVNGSLDKHVISKDLTWERRLRICLGAARGLQYLHEGVGKNMIVFHRDIKSSNILLDEKWEAKISDFGLSKIDHENPVISYVVTLPCGTVGYTAPEILGTNRFSKQSDVFSFGVVLFEVLCGKLANDKEYKDSSLAELGKEYYENGELKKIIMTCLLDQMKSSSLEVFSSIAFKCLNDKRKRRPSIGSIVEELEIALRHQLGTETIDSNPQTLVETELWGSEKGGKPFRFELRRGEKLTKISIFEITYKLSNSKKEVHGIHSLIFTAEGSNGIRSYQTYGEHPTSNKGREITIDFLPDEKLLGLSGTFGPVQGCDLIITSLSFVTNKNEYGPFGVKRESQFSKSWEVGLFDGFYGRCGWYIDSIGCLLKAIN